MTRQTHRRFIFLAQLLAVIGWGLAAVWNIGTVLFALPDAGWFGLLAPLPGLLLWAGVLAAPRLTGNGASPPGVTYRLVYTAPAGWSDERPRRALYNLARSVGGLAITWAREGQGVGCWLTIPGGDDLLKRVVAETFPDGQVELDAPPEAGTGVALLSWSGDLPTPDALCRLAWIDGVYFRWRSPETAVVALWGAEADRAAEAYSRRADRLPGAGSTLLHPPFIGRNPWPELPPFPASQDNPGLAAISHVARLAPELRVQYPALTLGEDDAGEPVGFPLPDLPGAEVVHLAGQAAAQVARDLAYQAIRERLPLFLLDGDGAVVAHLARHLSREIAGGQVLTCDLERPAQSRFRLNPFWLPDEEDTWPAIVAAWSIWLRELGLTLGGLGQAAYRHTLLAVILTALAARERGLILDPAGLRDALAQPDFLPHLDGFQAQPLLDAQTWTWWREQGRHAPHFDVHQRLGHLRERLSRLLALPEYRVLWQAPYLDLPGALSGRRSLLWRFPAGQGRLNPFIGAQLLALTTLLSSASTREPILVMIHGFSPGPWAQVLRSCASVRLFLSAADLTSLPRAPRPATQVLSRLRRHDAEAANLPGLRPADLRRLPPGRLIVQRGEALGAITMEALS